jgi:hypothetical protein
MAVQEKGKILFYCMMPLQGSRLCLIMQQALTDKYFLENDATTCAA